MYSYNSLERAEEPKQFPFFGRKVISFLPRNVNIAVYATFNRATFNSSLVPHLASSTAEPIFNKGSFMCQSPERLLDVFAMSDTLQFATSLTFGDVKLQKVMDVLERLASETQYGASQLQFLKWGSSYGSAMQGNNPKTSANAAAAICNFDNIRSLDLSHQRALVSELLLTKILCRLSNLRRLVLENITGIPDLGKIIAESIDAAEPQNLRALYLRRSQISLSELDEAFNSAADCVPALQVLDLSSMFCPGGWDGKKGLSFLHLEPLASSLQVLKLRRMIPRADLIANDTDEKTKDKYFADISTLKNNLVELDLAETTLVTAWLIPMQLEQFQHLKYLNLSDNPILSYQSMSLISQLKILEFLDLSQCTSSGSEGDQNQQQHHVLSPLASLSNSLRGLNLRKNKKLFGIGDKQNGMVHISKINSLKFLDVFKCDIVDGDLKLISDGLKNIEHLIISENDRITIEGVKNYLSGSDGEKLPNLKTLEAAYCEELVFGLENGEGENKENTDEDEDCGGFFGDDGGGGGRTEEKDPKIGRLELKHWFPGVNVAL